MTPQRLSFETLEARDVPAIFGNPWQRADGLTISFATDGAQYTSQTGNPSAHVSQLFSTLNGGMATDAWQLELLRAIDAWASVANINVGLVTDLGNAFGPAGFAPGAAAPTFRIGAASNGTDVIAVNTPNGPLSGGYAGTLMLNSAFTYSQGGANGTYDLYSVALNEFANLLGIADDDTDPGSALYGHYIGVRAGLSASDVSAVQAMYGARPADAFEGPGGNNAFASATTLTAAADPAAAGKSRVVADGDITTASDVDFYRFTTPAGATSFTVRLGTAGKSLLAGRVDVYDASGRLIASGASAGLLQGDTVLTLTGLQPNAAYTIKVSGARTDAFKTGAYQLRVGFGYDPVTETKADTVQHFGAEAGTNDARLMASSLRSTGLVANGHYDWTGQIETATDADFYRLTAPATGGVLTLTVTSAAGLSTSATVYSSTGQLIASNVLIRGEGGMYRAQVPNTVAGATYYVLLKAQSGSTGTGSYAASVDFAQPLATVQALTSGVANKASQIAVGIEVKESGTFRFNLGVTGGALSGMTAYVFDEAGNVVAVWRADAGSGTGTLIAALRKGQYTIQLVMSGPPAGTLDYALGFNRLSDPIDPFAPPDPTVPPPPPPPPGPPEVETGVIIILPPFIPWRPISD